MKKKRHKSKSSAKKFLWLFLFCFVWAVIYLQLPNFVFKRSTYLKSQTEQNYLLDLRKKYSGTQRILSVNECRAVIEEACDFIANAKRVEGIYDSDDAKELLFGTACIESGLRPRFQDTGGDAIGLFQVEYATFKDIWDRAIKRKHPELYLSIKVYFGGIKGDISFEDLQNNDVLCAIFARMKYAESSTKIPPKSDTRAQGEYYKLYYNTPLGKSTVNGYIKARQEILEKNGF